MGGRLAVLYEDVQALLDRQRRIEHDKSKTERKDIIAGTDFEEVANGTLQRLRWTRILLVNPFNFLVETITSKQMPAKVRAHWH